MLLKSNSQKVKSNGPRSGLQSSSRSIIGLRAATLAASILCLLLSSLWAQGPAPKNAKIPEPAPKEAASPATVPALAEADLGAFLDGILPTQIERETSPAL